MVQRDLDLYSHLIKRARKYQLTWSIFRLVESSLFNFAIYVLIVANTVVLALERYDLSEEEELTLMIANYAFTAIFFIEMILKIIALGLKNYLLDRFNAFDCIIVIISLIDFVVEVSSENEVKILKIFKVLRLLRAIKIAKQWESLQNMIHMLIGSLIDISSFSALLLVMVFIFALLGMELFAYSVAINPDGEFLYD